VKVVASLLDHQYKDCSKLTLVEDNLSAHRPCTFYEVYEPQTARTYLDRLEFVFTPKHGSWLNIAEIELHVLNGQCLNRPLDSIEKVKTEIAAWQKDRNDKNNKINWHSPPRMHASNLNVYIRLLTPNLTQVLISENHRL
jgi:hypothetical protein